jgi:hypothetical protein
MALSRRRGRTLQAGQLGLSPFELLDLFRKVILTSTKRLELGGSGGPSRNAGTSTTTSALPPHHRGTGKGDNNDKPDQKCCAH